MRFATEATDIALTEKATRFRVAIAVSQMGETADLFIITAVCQAPTLGSHALTPGSQGGLITASARPQVLKPLSVSHVSNAGNAFHHLLPPCFSKESQSLYFQVMKL